MLMSDMTQRPKSVFCLHLSILLFKSATQREYCVPQTPHFDPGGYFWVKSAGFRLHQVESGCVYRCAILDGVAKHDFALQIQAVKHMSKANLPQKPCVHCAKPMVWRKSWAKNWEKVKYCSDRCMTDAKRERASRQAPRQQP
ncbi:MAG: DUF2256 domain-containing protein [Rhizobiaceae bacterium]